MLHTNASKVAALRLLESARLCDCSVDALCLNLLEIYGHNLFLVHVGSFCFDLLRVLCVCIVPAQMHILTAVHLRHSSASEQTSLHLCCRMWS